MDEYVVKQLIKLENKIKSFEEKIDKKWQQKQSIKIGNKLIFDGLKNQFHVMRKVREKQKNIKKLNNVIEKFEMTKRELNFTKNAYFQLYSEIEYEEWSQKQIHRYVKKAIKKEKNV